MLPHILVSEDLTESKEYIETYRTEQTIAPSSVSTITPQNDKDIRIDQIRTLNQDISRTSNSKRVWVLHQFDTARIEAQNALLKTLEERQEHNIFFLTAQNISRILPTIQSRSRIVYLSNSSKKKELPIEKITAYENILTTRDVSFLGNDMCQVSKRPDAIALCDELLIFFQHRMENNPGMKEVLCVKKTLSTRSLLQNNNAGPQLSIDTLLIFVWKTYNKTI